MSKQAVDLRSEGGYAVGDRRPIVLLAADISAVDADVGHDPGDRQAADARLRKARSRGVP
jgi:hypothetical protein